MNIAEHRLPEHSLHSSPKFHPHALTMTRANPPRAHHKRRGAMLVFIVILMVGFIAAAALMIGVAQMQLARTELRTATDAAAKAAAQQLSLSQDRGEATAVARRVAAENLVNNEPLLLDNGDLQFGRSLQNASGTFVFHINETPINSVRVVGRRTAGSRLGVIPFFMGDILTSGSFEPVQSAIATYIERDVVLVIDRSGSMQGEKFRDLTSAINIFTETLKATPVEERVGLASYSTTSRQDVELTQNLGRIDSAVQQMSVGGLTSISAGMMDGRQIMQNSRSAEFVERTIIVMTDGLHNQGPEPRGVAQQLAGEGVVIHAITFGSTADQNRMREIATIGRGRFFHAVDGSQLRNIYREIALTLSTIITE